MKKVVIASDSFKGSLSSAEVAEAVAEGIRSVDASAGICCIPLSDGGEGLADCFVRTLGGRMMKSLVSDPLGRPIDASWGIVTDISRKATAVIDMAAAAGLPLLSPDERNPMKTTTYGVGQLIMDAIREECTDIILGLGGSATTDCGMGMLRALGVRFTDKLGHELSGSGEDLAALSAIDISGLYPQLRNVSVRVACDVTNPLYGPQGAAYVYAPQKGASQLQVMMLDEGLRNFAGVCKTFLGEDISSTKGAGAAGGMGAGLKAVLGAELIPGIDLFLTVFGFAEALQDCDLVITGEGRMDAQTLMGKAPVGVLKAAAAKGVPVIAIVGTADFSEALLSSGFAGIFPITGSHCDIAEAMQPQVAKSNLKKTAAHIAGRLNDMSGMELSDALRVLAGDYQF